jgi:hypothetical protein
VVEYEALTLSHGMLMSKYYETIQEIQMISNFTSFQPTVNDEQENFQSIDFLEDFSYPYSVRKTVKSEEFAHVSSNSSSKVVKTHKIYLKNTVVCLEEDWRKPLKFVYESGMNLYNWYNGITEKKIYECDEPINKL